MEPHLAGWYVYQHEHEEEPGEGQEGDRLQFGAVSPYVNNAKF